jgi:hypothetical protein
LFEFTFPDGAVYRGDSISGDKSYWDGETIKGVVVKSEDETKYTLTVAYPANSPDVAKARDGFQDFASPGTVEKAAWSYMRNAINNGGEIGAYHQDGTEGDGILVESYIYRGPDWAVKAADGTEQVIKTGDWLVGVIWSDTAWDSFKSGESTGVSMQGMARRQAPSPSDVARVVASKNARG